MKLAIVGGRDFSDYDLMKEVLLKFWKPGASLIIISGGARGADSLAIQYAKSYYMAYKVFLPDWDKYGKRAGYERNKQIVDECDKLIAFWDGKSKGTKHSISLAEKAGKLLEVVYYMECQ